jgi:YD repeat-containing protein
MGSEAVFFSMPDPEGDLVAVFEDDGRVAYAYLLQGQKIVADVWVYNRADAPEAPEWSDPDKAPFLNPRAFVREEVTIGPASSEADVTFEWRGPPTARVATLFIRGVRAAELSPGNKPGRATLALIAGPLADPLES